MFIAMQSLPVPIPWIPGAEAVYDLARCVDLTEAVYNDVMAGYIAREAELDTALDTADAAARPDLEAQAQANQEAAALFLLGYVRCQVTGINPSPVADRPETWAHVHPQLRRWLAYQGRAEAAAQLRSPLALLRRTL